jgi:membrane protein implicated in regulation of membrane protease activity
MTLNLNEWLGSHQAWLWLLAAALTASLYLLRSSRTPLWLAAALAVTALFSLVLPGHPWLSIAVAAALMAAALRLQHAFDKAGRKLSTG